MKTDSRSHVVGGNVLLNRIRENKPNRNGTESNKLIPRCELKTFETITSLVKKTSDNESESKNESARGDKLVCKQCGKEYFPQNEHHFLQHLLSHVESKKNLCQICGRRFKLLQTLKSHLKTHGPAKFVCTDCGKEFKQREGLTKHRITVHGINEELKCEVCDKTYKNKPTLSAHIRRHHGNNSPLQCPVCGMELKNGSSLKNHITTQHDVTEHVWLCILCRSQFSHRNYILSHLKRTHKLATNQYGDKYQLVSKPKPKQKRKSSLTSLLTSNLTPVKQRATALKDNDDVIVTSSSLSHNSIQHNNITPSELEIVTSQQEIMTSQQEIMSSQREVRTSELNEIISYQDDVINSEVEVMTSEFSIAEFPESIYRSATASPVSESSPSKKMSVDPSDLAPMTSSAVETPWVPEENVPTELFRQSDDEDEEFE